MRTINWRQFKKSNVVHFRQPVLCDFMMYNKDGKLYQLAADPTVLLPILVWANACNINDGWASIEFGFKEDAYVFGWANKRLSSLPEHEYYWRDAIWLTTGDRDYIIGQFLSGLT